MPDDEKLDDEGLTEEEKLCLAVGAMSLMDDEEKWEELWTKYPDKAKQILIAIGAEQLGYLEPDDEEENLK